MAARLAARVLIPIKQASSQLTTAPWRPQQKSEADRIQQKLHKKWVWELKKKKKEKGRSRCELPECVCVCVRQWEADLFQFCDYWWLLILKIQINKLFELLISNSWLELFNNGGNVRCLVLSMWQNYTNSIWKLNLCMAAWNQHFSTTFFLI